MQNYQDTDSPESYLSVAKQLNFSTPQKNSPSKL